MKKQQNINMNKVWLSANESSFDMISTIKVSIILKLHPSCCKCAAKSLRYKKEMEDQMCLDQEED